jgi:hypothetical protein
VQLFVALFIAMVEPFIAEQCMVLNERFLLLKPRQFMEYIREPFSSDTHSYETARVYGFNVIFRDLLPRPTSHGSVRLECGQPLRQVMVPFDWTCGTQSVVPPRMVLESEVQREADAPPIFRPVVEDEEPAISTSSSDLETDAAYNFDGADERDEPAISTSSSDYEADAAYAFDGPDERDEPGE